MVKNTIGILLTLYTYINTHTNIVITEEGSSYMAIHSNQIYIHLIESGHIIKLHPDRECLNQCPGIIDNCPARDLNPCSTRIIRN